MRLESRNELRSTILIGWYDSKEIELESIKPDKRQKNFIQRYGFEKCVLTFKSKILQIIQVWPIHLLRFGYPQDMVNPRCSLLRIMRTGR